MNEGRESQRRLQCVQSAGDIVYIPRGWGHATVNLEESAGVAVEFKLAASQDVYTMQAEAAEAAAKAAKAAGGTPRVTPLPSLPAFNLRVIDFAAGVHQLPI